MVSKLDRLGRSQVEVIHRLSDLQTKGIYVRTLDGLINTRGLGKLAPLVIGGSVPLRGVKPEARMP